MNKADMESNNKTYSKVFLHPFVCMATSVTAATAGMFFVLALQVLMLFVTKSFSSLVVLAAAVTGSAVAAGISYVLHSKVELSLFITLLQGLLAGLLLPASYPPVTVFIIVAVTLLLYKYAFREFSSSWINPIALAVAIAWFVGSSYFPDFRITADSLFVKNTSAILIQNGTFPVMSSDGAITDFLNKTIFNLMGITIPPGYVSMFWDTHSVIPAFRFNLITLISSIFLFASGIKNSVVPFCYTAVYAVLVYLFAPVLFCGVSMRGDIMLALLTSGTFFCALFVLPWNGTVPLTYVGRIIYGVTAGITAFFLVGCGTSPIGSVFTVLIANIISPVIQVFENRNAVKKLGKMVSKQNLSEIEVING